MPKISENEIAAADRKFRERQRRLWLTRCAVWIVFGVTCAVAGYQIATLTAAPAERVVYVERGKYLYDRIEPEE